MTTVTNKKLRNMNLTGRGAIVIEENILSEAERTLAEAVNPGQKYDCTVSKLIRGYFHLVVQITDNVFKREIY